MLSLVKHSIILLLSLFFFAACDTQNEEQSLIAPVNTPTHAAISVSVTISPQITAPTPSSTPPPTASTEPSLTPAQTSTQTLPVTAVIKPTRIGNPTATIPLDSLRAITPEASLIGVTTPEEQANAGTHTYTFECYALNDCSCPNTNQFVSTITFDEHSVTFSQEGIISWTYDELGVNLYHSHADDNEAFIRFELDGYRAEFWDNGVLCAIQYHGLP